MTSRDGPLRFLRGAGITDWRACAH
jgi:hypothetical protein